MAINRRLFSWRLVSRKPLLSRGHTAAPRPWSDRRRALFKRRAAPNAHARHDDDCKGASSTVRTRTCFLVSHFFSPPGLAYMLCCCFLFLTIPFRPVISTDNVYRTELRQICRICRTVAGHDQSEISFSIFQVFVHFIHRTEFQ